MSTSTTLAQSASAAHPDRGHVGLAMTLAPGNDGSYLRHDLAHAPPLLHVRFALAPATAAGGAVRIVGGHDDSGEPLWWIDYDADTRALAAHLIGQLTLHATLNALPWHTIELEIDANLGRARLWLNNILEDTVNDAAVETLATRGVWIGALFKSMSLTGELHLDEWAIATEPIGPVTVPPTSPYAADPTRWLVVYNRSVSDAVTWAEAYRQMRHVPLANLVGLELPAQETIDGGQYAALNNAISDYMTRAKLDGQIMGVLAGYRVPGYVEFDDPGPVDAVPTLLHLDMTGPGLSMNANAHDAPPTRPILADLGADRLTARIDGPDLDAALALSQRASHLMNVGLGTGDDAVLWFDPLLGPAALLESAVQDMIDWVQHVDATRLRLPIEVSGDLTQADNPGSFDQVHHDAFLWTWDVDSPSLPPAGIFTGEPGPRVACLALHIIDPTAKSVRGDPPVNWIETALDAGYAAAAAASRDYNFSGVPYPRPFFEALRQGWTLAEAWYLALPVLRQGLHLVGDPLLRVALPTRGWAVHGPMDRLEALDPAAPMHMLREQDTSLAVPAELLPEPGSAAHFVVRHLDAHDRAEASTTSVRIVNHDGHAAAPPMSPVYPDHPLWPVRIDDGEIVLTMVWDRPLSATRIASVALRGEIDGTQEATLAEPALDPRCDRLTVHLPMPEALARYRWRIVSHDGVALDTPWSQTVHAPAPPADALTLVEPS